MTIAIRTLLAIVGIAVGSDLPSSIPAPRDARGAVPLLQMGSEMADGTLLVSDSADRVWWSRDTGRHWDSIPPFTRLGPRYQGTGFAGWSPLAPKIFLGTILSRSWEGFWTPDSGWKDVLLPDQCLTNSGESMMDSPGWTGNFDSKSGIATYCRTSDGGRSWSEWFTLDSATVASTGTAKPFGRFAAGAIWYAFPDSGYLRGTSDGHIWRRIDPPSPFQAGNLISRGRSDLVILPSGSQNPDTALVSHDTGRTWSGLSVSKPGFFVEEIGHGYMSLSLPAPDRFASWISASLDGPWTFVDTTAVFGFVWLGEAPYRVAGRALTRIDLAGKTSTEQMPRRLPTLRWRDGFVALPAPANGPKRLWKLSDPSGRILSSGTASGNRIHVGKPPRGLSVLDVEGTAYKLFVP
jgi:hypothetical protein